MDAHRRSAANTREIRSVGVAVDAYGNRAESFYLHHEFFALSGHAGKLFLPMATIRQFSDILLLTWALAIWCSFGKAWYGNKVRGNILAMVM